MSQRPFLPPLSFASPVSFNLSQLEDFMSRVSSLTKLQLFVMFYLASAFPLTAETIFDNSANNLSASFQFGGMEVGDEIQLAGTARCVTNFSFQYFLYAAETDPQIMARVRIYLNDGPLPDFETYATPGSVLFESGWFVTTPAFYGNLELSAGSELPAGGLYLPSSDITWSVQFQGLGSGDSAGVYLYSPPVVGADLPYSWANAGTGWFRSTSVQRPFNFEAIMQASDVPETSSVALIMVGSSLLIIRRLYANIWPNDKSPEPIAVEP